MSDEVFQDLTHCNKKHINLASISKEISDITLTLISASKTFGISTLSLG